MSARKRSSNQVWTHCVLAAIGLLVAIQATARTIVDLQPNAATTLLPAKPGDGTGSIRLTNLNPDFNIWYVLEIQRPGDDDCCVFHLENPAPGRYTYRLDEAFDSGLIVTEGGVDYRCPLWHASNLSPRFTPDPRKTFFPLCENRILLRNPTQGAETTKEFVADFLRKHVWGGEAITGLVKDYLYKDRYLITSPVNAAAQDAASTATAAGTGPLPARIDSRHQGDTMEARELGIGLQHADPHAVSVGQWYTTQASADMFVSVIQPQLVDRAILATHTEHVRELDALEAKASVYLLAFNLHHLDLEFSLGTLHPSAEWSYRAPTRYKSSHSPGPDGIDNYEPLVMVGKLNPIKAPRVVATFTGGFKRTHGAFKWGRLSQINKASHYGFRVNGVTFSTLQPGLATLLIYRDGSVDMKTWRSDDARDLPRILHARQNGVPIIEWDERSGQGLPGAYVNDWGRGNWSGSAESEQRTLRAAACLQEAHGESYLIYAYFSSATPNAMARVFQAYGCRYAMHLDMNALEHTYSAVYLTQGNEFIIQHLNTGMDVLDKKEKETGTIVPRFVGSADNRDFFYVMEKE